MSQSSETHHEMKNVECFHDQVLDECRDFLGFIYILYVLKGIVKHI